MVQSGLSGFYGFFMKINKSTYVSLIIWSFLYSTSEIDEISCDCNEPVLLNTPEINPLASDPIDVPNLGDFEESSVSSSN